MSIMNLEWDETLEDDADLEEITRRYLPETVVWTTDWTTGSLVDQMSRGVFDVDPPFQRRNAWNDTKASLYIESLLLGCPVPPITLAELPNNNTSPHQYIVIDGKQRLSSLKRFSIDETLELKGLGVLHNLKGKNARDLSLMPEFDRFANLPIRTVVLRNWQKDEVLQFIFNRLNTQSTPLSTQELRRSLLAGPFMTYLDARSADSAPIRRILGIDEPDYRLRDSELLLRGLAFSTSLGRYRGNLKRFLDDFARQFNKALGHKIGAGEVEKASEELDRAIDFTFEVFGSAAFQKAELTGEFTNRFNRAVFDLMVWTFSQPQARSSAKDKAEDLVSAFTFLCGQEEFSRYLTSTTKSTEAVRGRFSIWINEIERIGLELDPNRLQEFVEM